MEPPQRMPAPASMPHTLSGGSDTLMPNRQPILPELIFSILAEMPLCAR